MGPALPCFWFPWAETMESLAHSRARDEGVVSALIVIKYRHVADDADSILILPARITLAHLSVSSTIYLSNSPGVIGLGMLPRSAKRTLIFGSAKAALISLLSFSTMTAGIAFGAPMPCQVFASNPGTNSPIVGRSGSACARVAVVTVSARTRPALILSIDSGSGLK